MACADVHARGKGLASLDQQQLVISTLQIASCDPNRHEKLSQMRIVRKAMKAGRKGNVRLHLCHICISANIVIEESGYNSE
jgi:hypothetical protein